MVDRVDEVTASAEAKTEEKEARRSSAFNNIPPIIMGLVILGFVFIFWTAYNAGQDGLKKVMIWIVALILVIIWFMTQPTKGGMLSPLEVKVKIKQYVKDYKQMGILPHNVQFKTMLEGDLQNVDGKPAYYLTGLKAVYPDMRVEYWQCKTDPYSGYCNFQKAAGRITGRETVMIRNIMPRLYKDLEDRGLLGQVFKKKGGGGN